MLILLKQVATETEDYNGLIIWQQWFFDSATLSVITYFTTSVSAYEMTSGQLIFANESNSFFYNGSGGVNIVAGGTSVDPTYSLSLVSSDLLKGTVSDLTATAPYQAGEEISVLASPVGLSVFVNWTRNGTVASTLAAYTFPMPSGNITLIANFFLAAEIPAPEIENTFEKFYPLEIRIGTFQIPIKSVIQNVFPSIGNEDWKGDFSLSLSIQNTEKNSAALGHPDLAQGKGGYKEPLKCALWKNGNKLYEAKLDIIGGDSVKINATLIRENAYTILKGKSVRLRDCYPDSDIIVLDQPVYATGGYEIRFNFRDIKIKINGVSKQFIKTQYENHNAMLQAIATWLSSLVVGLEIRKETTEEPTDETAKIIYWDTSIPTTCTITVSTGTSRYTRAKKLTNAAIDMGVFNSPLAANRIAFPSIYNKELYQGNNSLFNDVVNKYNDEGNLMISNIRYSAYSEVINWKNTLIPFVYLKDVILKTFESLGIKITGDFLQDPRLDHLLLYNNHTLDYFEVSNNGTPSRRNALAIHGGDQNPESLYTYENVHDFNIQLKNHIPDYSVTEFLSALKSYFLFKYNFNGTYSSVEIKFIKDIVRTGSVLDLSKLISKSNGILHGKSTGLAFRYDNPDPLFSTGDSESNPTPTYTVLNYLAMIVLDAELFETCFVESLQAYFKLNPDNSNPPIWELTGFKMKNEKTTDKEEYSFSMYPMVDAYIDDRKMPAIEATVDNQEVSITNKEIGFRITGFYGQKSTIDGKKYGYASTSAYTALETFSPEMFDLNPRGEDHYPFFKDLERMKTESVKKEGDVLLNENLLKKMLSVERIKIENTEFILDEFQVSITEKEFSVAKVSLLKIK